jgi:hypothetical protein
MAQDYFSNNATTTLNGAIDNVTTTIVVNSNTLFPANAQFRIIIDSEVMTVTAGQAGLSWTVTRNSESIYNGSGAVTHASGATVTQIITAGSLTNAIALPVAGATWGASVLLTLASVANSYGLQINGPAGVGTSFGLGIAAGTNSSDYAARFQTQALVDILKLRGDGQIIANAPITVPPSASASIPSTSYGTLPVKLDEQSTASGASLTLTVPAGALYRSLEIEFTGRSSAAANSLVLQFNGDVAGNYDSGGLNFNNATVVAPAPSIASTSGVAGGLPASTATAGAVGDYRIVIHNADSTTLRKTWIATGGRFDSDAAVGYNYLSVTGQWRNTTNAITSIVLSALGGVSLVNARAILWGRP